MEKNFLYAALSIVAVALVALGIFYFAGALGGGNHEGGEGGGTGEGQPTSEQLFFDAVLKPSNYNEYTYAYEESASSGYSNTVFMAKNQGLSYIKKDDAIFFREVFITPESTILCFGNVNRELCAPIPQNSTMNPYVQSIAALLFTPESVQANYNMNKKFIEFGALKMSPAMVEKEYAGKKCTELSYTIDYSKMTVEQLISLGIDAGSAEMLISKQYNFTVCIDPATKDLIHKKMDYLNLGVPAYTEYYTTEATWGSSSSVALPASLMNESDLIMFFNAARMSQQRFLECLLGNQSDSCLRAEAISSGNEKICKSIKGTDMRDSCYVNIGLAKKDATFCLKITPEFADDCYLEFAWRALNTSYCGMMSDPVKKQNCTSTVEAEIADWEGESQPQNNTTSEPPAAGTKPAGECAKDSDCVRAGCSSQLCVPSASAGIVTTCEYKSEYDCLPLSSCGCNAGKCGWAQTPEYLNCLDSKKSN